MASQADRREAIRDLIHLRRPLNEVHALLSAAAPPSQDDLATLVTQDISHVLNEFLSGRLSTTELEAWAEAVHGCEDIALDPDDRDFLADALFELSTPELCGPANEVVVALGRRIA